MQKDFWKQFETTTDTIHQKQLHEFLLGYTVGRLQKAINMLDESVPKSNPALKELKSDLTNIVKAVSKIVYGGNNK